MSHPPEQTENDVNLKFYTTTLLEHYLKTVLNVVFFRYVDLVHTPSEINLSELHVPYEDFWKKLCQESKSPF